MINPGGQVVQVVAVVWDATGTRRLQQKIDAIDKAGRELVRLEADAMSKLNVGQRLKLLEDKIISFTRDLMHFDHFAIRLLDRKTNKLEMVISVGLPTEALNIELFAETEGNGISGYVAATGRSYICPDVERDPRYVMGLDQAKSSLTVPLRLHDKVIGIFNIESRAARGVQRRRPAVRRDLRPLRRDRAEHPRSDGRRARRAPPQGRRRRLQRSRRAAERHRLRCQRADGRLHRPRRSAQQASADPRQRRRRSANAPAGGRGPEHRSSARPT